jgi:ubiquinone/menaquinone biosynthesis C-methylase UbiE
MVTFLIKKMNGLYSIRKKGETELFDPWPEKYDQWFTTPIGALVKRYEVELILDLLDPRSGETVLDAGCGTGVFTLDILSFGTHVTGVDISLPMLLRAMKKSKEYSFQAVLADMSTLPCLDNAFDKVVSITALEFIEDAKGAMEELFRVTRQGGRIVVATLNRLSPWADRWRVEAKNGHSLFKKAIFRSPDELLALVPFNGVIRTAVHFQKEDDPLHAAEIEKEGQRKSLNTGAFVLGCWQKP